MADDLAYVDEAVADGVYVLAAALSTEAADQRIDAALRALLLPRQRRLHWHHESPPRRLGLASAVGDLEVRSLVVVGSPVDGRRQDRARRLCLERLLWELQSLGIARIVVESRQPERDRADVRALAAFRRSGVLAPHMTVVHARPLRHQGLWLADIVAGAVLADLRGDDRYRKPLDELLRLCAVELR